jgi:hypothetical protein
MNMLFHNWLEEGYYEDDGYGLTRIEDPVKIHELQSEGRLYQHDGMCMNKVNEDEIITIKKNKYNNE